MAARAIGIGFQGVTVGLAVRMRPAHPLLVLLAPHQDAPLLDEVAPWTHGPTDPRSDVVVGFGFGLVFVWSSFSFSSRSGLCLGLGLVSVFSGVVLVCSCFWSWSGLVFAYGFALALFWSSSGPVLVLAWPRSGLCLGLVLVSSVSSLVWSWCGLGLRVVLSWS